MKTAERVRKVFKEHGGILRSSEAGALGIHRQTLSRMLKQGVLERPARGLYVLAGQETLHGDLDLIRVTRKVPKAVICLISALSFHGLTTQIPYAVYVALPKGGWKPTLKNPRLEIIWLTEEIYQTGIETHSIEGIEIAVYCLEKTIADCFKFRSKIGEDVAIEALTAYFQRDSRDIGRLVEYADLVRVRSVMEPYMKALV
jgi:predicted transcriptional regulator of viral defense system